MNSNFNNPNISNSIGQFNLIFSDILNSNSNSNLNSNLNSNSNLSDKLKSVETNIKLIEQKFISNNYNNQINSNYIKWIEQIRLNFIEILKNNNLYCFFKFNPQNYSLNLMKDYWDVNPTEKLFSFSLFINNPNNLTYLVGLCYNYAIMRKHFPSYVMRIYIDFHSVFGSPETFNVFNMFIDVLKDIDENFFKHIQMIVFFLNPYYNVDGDSIFEPFVYDINDVLNWFNNIFYNSSNILDKSPLLNFKLETKNESEIKSTTKSNNLNKNNSKQNESSKQNDSNKKKIFVNNDLETDEFEINYKDLNVPTSRASFCSFSTHLAVNLRFLPLNENCEYHIRDLDSRLSLTDMNIINKFYNPKYKYVPFYVFQFYKFYFPYLKWRIDVNPYLAGCFGGSNLHKSFMISKDLEQSENMRILRKEIFFKYILFISFNCANLQVGFLNDEFILANIFTKIKGIYSENILYLNLGSFANKHVNEYYYGINNSDDYPCILKLGTPIDILRYPLNGKYVTIDPITDFKFGTIPLKYHSLIKNLITEQINIYLGNVKNETNILANKIRQNYKSRLEDEINDDLEAALFFSMIPKTHKLKELNEFDTDEYNKESLNNQFFSSVGDSTYLMDDSKLKTTNFMMVGYLLADVLEDIIFPLNPKFINSTYYLSNDNYDRLFNCLYFDEKTKKFIQRKITKNDISRKYIDHNIISHIPQKFLNFDSKEQVISTLNIEFNEYLNTCTYYPNLYWYIERTNSNNLISIGDKQIKSGILLFIKNYKSPIYDNLNNVIYSIDDNIKTLKYNLDKKKETIRGININKNKLKFNIIFIDGKFVNQFNYNNTNNKNDINIKILKSSHLNKLDKLLKLNKQNYNDFLIIDNL